MENTICVLRPVSASAPAAFGHQHNKTWYTPASPSWIEYGREPTPATEIADTEDDDLCNSNLDSTICLTFNPQPKDIKQGFVFGSSSTCDIILGTPKNRISARHFRITYDDQGRLVLIDQSTNGTTLKFDGQSSTRRHFQWIVLPEYKQIEVKIGKPPVEFSIKVPAYSDLQKHQLIRNSYVALIKQSQKNDRKEPSPNDFNHLTVRSSDATALATAIQTPNHEKVYIVGPEIGRGVFAQVKKVTDVSTGNVYASKIFKKGYDAREARIMTKVRHEHIVRFVEFVNKPHPSMIMEYVQLGSLAEQAKQKPISNTEIFLTLRQLLHALAWLHDNSIVHRDIKPENVLIRSRDPWHSVLADFGLSQDAPFLKTFCGSLLYCAPEIYALKFRKSLYTSAIDIWSLGLLVYIYVYGLPFREVKDKEEEIGWYEIIVKEVQNWDDELADFLSDCMIKLDPSQRKSTEECLNSMPDPPDDLSFSNDQAKQTHLTPGLQSSDDQSLKSYHSTSTGKLSPKRHQTQTQCLKKSKEVSKSSPHLARSKWRPLLDLKTGGPLADGVITSKASEHLTRSSEQTLHSGETSTVLAEPLGNSNISNASGSSEIHSGKKRKGPAEPFRTNQRLFNTSLRSHP